MRKNYILENEKLDGGEKGLLKGIWEDAANPNKSVSRNREKKIQNYFAEEIAKDLNNNGAILVNPGKFLSGTAVDAYEVLSSEDGDVKAVLERAFTQNFEKNFLENVYYAAFQECPAEALYIKIVVSD